MPACVVAMTACAVAVAAEVAALVSLVDAAVALASASVSEAAAAVAAASAEPALAAARSEEHTSELQSLMRISYAVFCLQKKKKKYETTLYQNQCTHHNIKNITRNIQHSQHIHMIIHHT